MFVDAPRRLNFFAFGEHRQTIPNTIGIESQRLAAHCAALPIGIEPQRLALHCSALLIGIEPQRVA